MVSWIAEAKRDTRNKIEAKTGKRTRFQREYAGSSEHFLHQFATKRFTQIILDRVFLASLKQYL